MEPTLAPRPVMDIQPQRPAPQPLSRADFAAAAPPATIITPTSTPAPTNLVMPQQPAEEHHEVQPTPTEFPANLPKAKAPIAIILLALLVGLSLIGLTIYGYLQTQKKTTTTTTTDTNTTQGVTAEEINDTVTSTDAAMEALEAAGLNTDDLSDDGLGL